MSRHAPRSRLVTSQLARSRHRSVRRSREPHLSATEQVTCMECIWHPASECRPEAEHPGEDCADEPRLWPQTWKVDTHTWTSLARSADLEWKTKNAAKLCSIYLCRIQTTQQQASHSPLPSAVALAILSVEGMSAIAISCHGKVRLAASL